MRIGRYLFGRPRMIWKFDLQEATNHFETHTDANWAGCRRTRKSTSGGVIMAGDHQIKSWAKTQATIATSSAESELLASVKGAAEGFGIVSLGDDLGMSLKVRLRMDAAAALGILERRRVEKGEAPRRGQCVVSRETATQDN